MPKSINEIGNIYNNLQVIGRASNKNGRAQWICECIQCKKQYIYSGTVLRLSKQIKCEECDLVGQHFGKLTVLELSHRDSSRNKVWVCQCECGNKETATTTYLHSGKKTQCKECLKNEHRRIRCQEIGNRYGYLEVLELDLEKSINQKVYWKCKCHNCGNVVSVQGGHLRNSGQISCGCIKSKGEQKISQILSEHNIKFKTQIIFDDFISNNEYHYRFDFGIYNENDELLYLIEYDGIQHFQTSNCGWNNQQNLINIQKSDNIKNKYCYDNHIPLIRIPYTQYTKLNLQDLQLSTSKFLINKE